jgi:hypothetical protein
VSEPDKGEVVVRLSFPGIVRGAQEFRVVRAGLTEEQAFEISEKVMRAVCGRWRIRHLPVIRRFFRCERVEGHHDHP